MLGSAAAAVKATNNDPKMAHMILDTFPSSPQVEAIRRTIDTDPNAFGQLIDQAIANSPEQRKIGAEELQAKGRAAVAGLSPLGDRQPQRQEILNQGWNLMNPGKANPYQLPPNATEKDYADSIGALDRQVQFAGVQDQRNWQRWLGAQNLQLHGEMLQLAAEGKQQQTEQRALTWVQGTDPTTGKTVMAPLSQAQAMGLKDLAKADPDDQRKAMSARHFLELADNSDPTEPGIMQIINKLDKEGQLGAVASRWNDLMAGRIGADPTGGDFEKLRVAMGLGTTALMNLHVGSRGGSYLMEHFEDMANAKKMNAQTLRAGVAQEIQYARQRAMQPGTAPTGGVGGGALSPAGPLGGGQLRPGATPSPGNVPAGAVKVGRGSMDGKRHYLDAQNNDLGVAE
jgi:hypothetical protein